jgi:hypothetical protein
MERIRKIDIESVSEEQFLQIEQMLRKKIKEKVEQAVADMNKYLNVYGLEVVLGVQIVKQGEANLIKEMAKKSFNNTKKV